jgi:NTE family protein
MATAPQPIHIQLAIQGGGAKIVAMMATLEALEERGHKIKVTRIVGTSAGAFAGAFFASGVGIKEIADEWRKGGLQTLLDSLAIKKHWYLPTDWSLLLHMHKKQPLWDEEKIQAFLEGVINKKNSKFPRVVNFTDLRNRVGIDVSAVSTNLHYRSSEVSLEGHPVVQSLIGSAGLPYLLRKWGGNPVIVDGGIGDNLPSAHLDMNLQNVTTVGISFKPWFDPKQFPTTFKSFSLALLDVAMEVSTKKSAELIPHTHFIDTEITTIDFVKAMAVLNGTDYQAIKDKAGVFFDELEQKIRTLAQQKATSYSVMNLHPWQSENLVAQAVMSGVWDAVSRQFGHQQHYFHQVELRATLGGVAQPPLPDVVTTTIDFEAGPDPLYCYFMGVSDGVKKQLTKSPTLTIQSLDTQQFVPHVRVPAVSSQDMSTRYEVIFFTPALVKGKRYRLIQTEEGTGLMGDLAETGHDELGVDPQRVLGVVERNRLIVDVPASVRRCVIEPKRNMKSQTLAVYTPEQLAAMDDVRAPPGYRTHMVEGTRTEGLFAIDITVLL